VKPALAEIRAFIALGANLGDPAAQIERAFDELARLPDTRLVARSGLYLSKAEGYEAQPDFVNAVALLATRQGARTLLEALLDIEARHGRRRAFKNAPRTLDLDLLLYDGLVLHEPGLTLPHPRMCERVFVLQPMSEISPDQSIPGRGSIAECLAQLPGAPLQRLPGASQPLARRAH